VRKTETTNDPNKVYVSPHGSGSEKFTPKKPENCKFFNSYPGCSANLCPLDPMVKTLGWYSDESDFDEICRNPEFENLQFIKTQKKIKKVRRKKKGLEAEFFTYAMLDRDIIVRPGIQGINPDFSDSKEEQWIRNHPERKKPSEKEIEKRREKMKILRERRIKR